MELKEFTKGLWKENPVFRMVIGMCPTLAVTTAAINGLVMGLATTFVLLMSGIIVSLIKGWVPQKIRIPSYIVIVATFVTIADYLLAAWIPGIHQVLGIYVPLIVVNCLILGRIEAFSSKRPVLPSVLDALGMGLGFTIALLILASVREVLGAGTWFGIHVLSFNIKIFQLPAGAFIALGLLIAILNKKQTKCMGCSTCSKN